MVLAGIESSPKIFDFRASGIPVQECVDFFDTLKPPSSEGAYKHNIYIRKPDAVKAASG